ncbi:MAG: hypothetical protein FJX59_06495 [Alphaproteobacteria bacterium]|nr:hypothetical protein [Alphaproteobacteria bacterium]
MVTVGYERITGRRALHQVSDGFNASVSRTLPVSARAAHAMLDDDVQRRSILGRKVALTTNRPGKVVRFAWPQGRVFINFVAKGRAKCQIAIQHEKLPSAAAVKRSKSYWAAAANRWLKSLV